VQPFLDGLKWFLAGPVIGAAAVLVATWATHHWGAQERSAERREIRRAAMLAQRDKDLRELGDLLTQLVTAAQEIIWERLRLAGDLLPRSDPRSMRLTGLAQRVKLFRIVVGDEELSDLAGRVSSAARKLSDSPVEDPGLAREENKDTEASLQALKAALSRIETLLRETETATDILGDPTTGRRWWQWRKSK
jgi:hypothetical protein